MNSEEKYFCKVNSILNRLSCSELNDIASVIICAAADFWLKANRMDDFCVQDIGEDCIIFGSINRVIWRPQIGFTIDKSYCTEHFLNSNKTD